MKNYENPPIFVKVTAKKSVAAFYADTVYTLCVIIKSPKEVTFYVAFVCLSICLSACWQLFLKATERIFVYL